ncbi:MAG: hypothetical protein EOQ50_18415 [Mesorhizobium sp.]|uniref:hypothetical protein n=1 Tax=Mesorhizobium sp. TaxID=1871066 RepID=UPI000FEA7004|nr:hypothetical protein [Mesorhizobium sp.]RWB72942.1 MAG: hypothetical protein EOQ50_18415 [Mesorhizobium sp.]
MSDFLSWLQTQPPSIGSFLGSLTGAGIGLIAIVLGALFNAYLNRRRDDRLRKVAAKAAAIGITAELLSVERVLRRNAADINGTNNAFIGPDVANNIRNISEIIQNIQDVDHDTLGLVISAYVLIDEYSHTLVLFGGEIIPNMPRNRVIVKMPAGSAGRVVGVNNDIADQIAVALKNLERYTK